MMYQLTGNPVFDALASIGIGVVLVLTAIVLALESKSLLIGESANPEVVDRFREILEVEETILSVNEVATLHMGPEFIVVTISLYSDLDSFRFFCGAPKKRVDKKPTLFKQLFNRSFSQTGSSCCPCRQL